MRRGSGAHGNRLNYRPFRRYSLRKTSGWEPPLSLAVLPQMRIEIRAEECRRLSAECAQKALCQANPEVRRIFAKLAEQWRALAEQAEFLQQYH
jgi:hypothetical protein